MIVYPFDFFANLELSDQILMRLLEKIGEHLKESHPRVFQVLKILG